MVVQYMHDVVDGAERVCFVKEVLCEAGGWAIVVEGTFMLVVASGKLSTNLSHIGLIAFGQVSLYTHDDENLSGFSFLGLHLYQHVS
jgi:hypothetical protein